MLRVGIVANEVSGDILGAALIKAIKAQVPACRFEGVAGPLMQAQGCVSLVPMERLSVMGLVEVLRHLPELLAIRRRIRRHFLAEPPDVFIGVDAPDFNLQLEVSLRRAGIKTVHCVSPTVWAWRPGRVRRIRRAVDLMLSLFPFEVSFLEQRGVPVRYVGHPLAEEIPLEVDAVAARRRLGLPTDGPLVAVLPGSRLSEARLLSEAFVGAAAWCRERRPRLRFAAPLVNSRLREEFESALRRVAPDLSFTLVDGDSRSVIAAADVVLTASGTATLEALLLQRPMVVAYRMNPLTFWIIRKLNLVTVKYMAMANLLAGEELAPEFLQDACRPELLGKAVLDLLDDPPRVQRIRDIYSAIHLALRRDSGREAAQAVLRLVGTADA